MKWLILYKKEINTLSNVNEKKKKYPLQRERNSPPKQIEGRAETKI